jgi:hypothetical protein
MTRKKTIVATIARRTKSPAKKPPKMSASDIRGHPLHSADGGRRDRCAIPATAVGD